MGSPTLKAISLLFERIRVVVVAVALPEARAVIGSQLDAAEPLGALPEVLARNHQPERTAVLRRERLAVCVRREQRERIAQECDRHVRRIALLGVSYDEMSRRLRLYELL